MIVSVDIDHPARVNNQESPQNHPIRALDSGRLAQ
jgi:hypothetical protein